MSDKKKKKKRAYQEDTKYKLDFITVPAAEMLIRGKSKLKEYGALSAVFSSGSRVAVYSEPSTWCSSSTAPKAGR